MLISIGNVCIQDKRLVEQTEKTISKNVQKASADCQPSLHRMQQRFKKRRKTADFLCWKHHSKEMALLDQTYRNLERPQKFYDFYKK